MSIKAREAEGAKEAARLDAQSVDTQVRGTSQDKEAAVGEAVANSVKEELGSLKATVVSLQETVMELVESYKKVLQANEELRVEAMETPAIREEVLKLREEILTLRKQLTKGQQPQTAVPAGKTWAQAAAEGVKESAQPIVKKPMGSILAALYCTIEAGSEKDAVELPERIRGKLVEEMRGVVKNKEWKPLAVKRDQRQGKRLRVLCRTEQEHKQVKEALEKVKPAGTKVLRDQLFPVRLDNVPARAILNAEGQVRPEAAREIEEEEGCQIAKIAWLSPRGKAYGSIVVFFKDPRTATAALREGFFTVKGESVNTAPFEPKIGPRRCYWCQRVGHKAHACTGKQICAHCAREGHSHRECRERLAKCATCGGPHGAYDKNCRGPKEPTQAPTAPVTPPRHIVALLPQWQRVPGISTPTSARQDSPSQEW